MSIKVSIILPVYNVEKYLDKCLTSLVNQTLKEIEIICVIDASPDNSIDICRKFAEKDARIKIIDKKVNEGLGYTRNTGLKYTSGEFIAFVDSDDYVDINMYEKLYCYAKLHNLDACFCDYQNDIEGRLSETREIKHEFVMQNSEEVREFMLDMIAPSPTYPSDVKYVVSCCRSIYSSAIIRKYEISFESEREIASEDVLFNMDFLSRANSIGYIPFKGYFYRYNPTSLSRGYTHKKFEAYKKLLIEIEERLKKYCKKEQYILHYQRCLFYFFRNIIKYESIKNINGKRFSNIRMRCEDPILQDVYTTYPYKQLPLKQRLFFFCMSHKISVALYAACILENKIRKNI